MNSDTDIKQTKKAFFENEIPDWYLNYADGVPKFARYFQEELLSFKNYKDQNLLNAVCLAVAVYINAKDLVHDISQTMFNKDFPMERDECMSVICDSIDIFSSEKQYIIHTSNPIETAIRVALAHCAFGSKAYDIIQPEENQLACYDDICRFVGVVSVIGRII
jgi:hypothetical protein